MYGSLTDLQYSAGVWVTSECRVVDFDIHIINIQIAGANTHYNLCIWWVDYESCDPYAGIGGTYITFDATEDQEVTGFYNQANSFKDNILSYADFLAITTQENEGDAEVFDSSLDGLF